MDNLEVEEAQQAFLTKQNASRTRPKTSAWWNSWYCAFSLLILSFFLCLYLVTLASSRDQVRVGQLSKSALQKGHFMPAADVNLKMCLGCLQYNAT